jgi:hypothetical protein
MKNTRKMPVKGASRGDMGKTHPVRLGRPVPKQARKDSGGGRKSTGKKGK